MSKETENIAIRLEPEQRRKLKSCVEDVSGHMQFIADRRGYINDTCKLVKDEFGIDNKTFRKMCKTFNKHNYSEEVHKETIFQTIYENVIGTENEEE